MSSRKRKRNEVEEWIKKQTKARSKAEDLLCIIHSQKLSQYGNFTSFDDGKDTHRTKLETLHKIRGRRLQEDASLSNRMQDVCHLIPETVDRLDIPTDRCYQRYTENLDRLRPAVMSPLASPVSSLEPCSSSAVPPRSPRKRVAKSVSEESTVLLPPDQCLFCDKKTIKKCGKKKLPTKTLTDWSHKSSGWQNIEKMATEMQSYGHSSLLRKVAGVGLFAAEAHFHPSCYHNSTANINDLQDSIN